jgi:hypothetical protein
MRLACRWYRGAERTPQRLRLTLITVLLAGGVLGGFLAIAGGGAWWPGFGAGLGVASALTAAWVLYVLGVLAWLRWRRIPIERYLRGGS